MWSVYISIFFIITIISCIYYILTQRQNIEYAQDVNLAAEGKELLLVHIVSILCFLLINHFE